MHAEDTPPVAQISEGLDPPTPPSRVPAEPSKRNSPGANTKCTDEIIQKIVALAEKGYTQGTIEDMCGLSQGRLSKWLVAGEKSRNPENQYRKLFKAFKMANRTVEMAAVDTVIDVMKSAKDPKVKLQAAQFYLSRRRPEEWARRDNVETKPEDTGGLDIDKAREAMNKALDRIDADNRAAKEIPQIETVKAPTSVQVKAVQISESVEDVVNKTLVSLGLPAGPTDG